MSNEKQVRSVLIRGVLHFIGDAVYNFKGPLRKGLRPIIWQTKPSGDATSFALVSDVEIYPGEKEKIEIVILNELQFRKPITEQMILSVGTIMHSEFYKFGEFQVLEHLREWQGGKVP